MNKALLTKLVAVLAVSAGAAFTAIQSGMGGPEALLVAVGTAAGLLGLPGVKAQIDRMRAERRGDLLIGPKSTELPPDPEEPQ